MATPAIEFAGINKVYQRRFGGVQVAALSNISPFEELARGESLGVSRGPMGQGRPRA